MDYNFPCRQPVVSPNSGSGSITATLSGVANKFTYVYKVIGYTDTDGVITVSCGDQEDLVFYAKANVTFDINLYGWYKSVATEVDATATVTTTTNGSIAIIGECL